MMQTKPIELMISLVKLLCFLCTVKTNNCYIPGETTQVERLRKLAIDSGTYSTVNFIYENMDESKASVDSKEMITNLKSFMQNKVFNHIDLNDLAYQ